MAAHNLLNMYVVEELREFLPEVILCAVFSLLLSTEKPHSYPPVFYATLLNSCIFQSKNLESFKKLES